MYNKSCLRVCLLLQAFSHLREEVRDFLGHPIRARIKGTTVQRPSAVTKKSHYPSSYPSVQNVYNGQQPVSAMILAQLHSEPTHYKLMPCVKCNIVISWPGEDKHKICLCQCIRAYITSAYTEKDVYIHRLFNTSPPSHST